ncbi:AbrB family transcriptional regulator [Ruegeria atlantica]|nr:AbrB family transcriptional regulator [Ruegeria atlantica]
MQRSVTLILAMLGTAVFWALNLPLPFLFGPMSACLIAALAHAPMWDFGQISVGSRTILGVAVGASITPSLFAELPKMAASLLLIPVFILLIAMVGVPFFRKFWGFDDKTAFFAAMPGGFQDMVALLRKSDDSRTSPFPGRIYPTAFVTGMPRPVNRLRTAMRT